MCVLRRNATFLTNNELCREIYLKCSVQKFLSIIYETRRPLRISSLHSDFHCGIKSHTSRKAGPKTRTRAAMGFCLLEAVEPKMRKQLEKGPNGKRGISIPSGANFTPTKKKSLKCKYLISTFLLLKTILLHFRRAIL